MRRRVVPAILLALVWLGLWPGLTPVTVLGATAAGVVVALIALRVPPTEPGRRWLRPVAALHYALRFLYDLTVASLAVAWETLTMRPRGRPGIVAVPLKAGSPGLITLVGNTVSLTPGSVTVDVREDPPTLYVHLLQLEDADEARRHIAGLEELAVAAFGTPAERRSIGSIAEADGEGT